MDTLWHEEMKMLGEKFVMRQIQNEWGGYGKIVKKRMR